TTESEGNLGDASHRIGKIMNEIGIVTNIAPKRLCPRLAFVIRNAHGIPKTVCNGKCYEQTTAFRRIDIYGERISVGPTEFLSLDAVDTCPRVLGPQQTNANTYKTDNRKPPPDRRSILVVTCQR